MLDYACYLNIDLLEHICIVHHRASNAAGSTLASAGEARANSCEFKQLKVSSYLTLGRSRESTIHELFLLAFE